MEEEEEVMDVYRPQQIEEPSGEDRLPMTDAGAEAAASPPQRGDVVEEGASEAAAVPVAAVVHEINDLQLLGSPEALPPAGAEEGEEEGAYAAPDPPVHEGAVEEEASATEAAYAAPAPPAHEGAVEEEASATAGEEEASATAGEEETSATAVEEETSAMAVEEEISPMAVEEETSAMAVEEEASVLTMKDETSPLAGTAGRVGGRKKRGRPARVQATKPPTKKKEEEDVCFICFDGGNLVVCDRRGCPKVYHPGCVNRDEAFFRSKGRWNCGWHICSVCEKAAHYMCYTCTYSLCKGCIKEAGFVCVRGNKGFCQTCMSTVMLIETKEQAKEKTVGVDFDDKNSWEYLFKDYWLDLKGKLSITFEELTRAKNPWKGSLVRNEESSDELYDANGEQGSSSDSSLGLHEGSSSTRKKVRRRSRTTVYEEGSKDSIKLVDTEGTSGAEGCEWASKELLEFVMHMKNGDKSVLSQFDVQALLLEYIKQNNLRDPRRKSQIICDSRLENLFGKARVGHFEMLKLLESHFLTKEASQVVTDDSPGGLVDPESIQMDAEGNSDVVTKMSSDKRRKTRKRIEEREPQTNLDDFAAIDVHNINLIYLRRNLMEDLLDDIEQFNDKVVGSFVRIRISGTGQRQDMYRLVQVVGTSKAPEVYKTGKKTTDISLEILNLNKKEILPIDSISNQEFTEEECKRLRQSIKCGLISRLTVGEVQEKARVLQAVRVNDWLESEKLRLGHLRDRASEKGRRKELRECVEKLQLLSTPEERSRRLREIPEVHADPKMDPSYESAEEEESDDKKLENYNRPRDSGFMRMGRDLGKGGLSPKDGWNGTRKVSTASWEPSRNTATKGAWDKGDAAASGGDRTVEVAWNHGKDMQQPNSHLANPTGLETGVWSNSQPAIRPGPLSGIAPETTAASHTTGIATSSNTIETEKVWHYKDPSGKIQGPFSMTQLRKWKSTGYFPLDLKIWRTSEKQEDSVLLTDALEGKFQKEPPPRESQHNSSSQIQRVAVVMDGREGTREGGWRGNTNSTWMERKQNDGNWQSSWNDSNFSPVSNVELAKANGWATQPSAWSASSVEAVGGRAGSSSRGWELSKDANSWTGQPQTHNSTTPLAPFSGTPYQPPAHQGRGVRDGNSGRWNGGPDLKNISNRPTVYQPSSHGYERNSRWGSSGQQSSGGLSKIQPANDPSNRWGNDSFNLPTPTPKPSSAGWMSGHGTGNKSSASPAASAHPTSSGWGTSPNPRGNSLNQSPIGTNESNKSASGWVEQSHASTTSSVGGRESHPPATISTDKASKFAEGFVAPQILNKVDDLHDFHTSSQQRMPSEPDPPIILANQSNNEVILKDERASPNSGRVVDCLASSEAHGEFDKCPTLTDEQVNNDALSSKCHQQVPPLFSEAEELPAASHSDDVGPDKKCSEAHNFSASECTSLSADCKEANQTSVTPVTLKTLVFPAHHGPEVDSMHGNVNFLSENMAGKGPASDMENFTPLGTSKFLESDMQMKPTSHMGLENSSLNVASSNVTRSIAEHSSDQISAINDPVVGSHGLDPLSADRQVVGFSGSQGIASVSAPKQNPGSSSLKPSLSGDGWGDQSQSQLAEPIVSVPEHASSGNLSAPEDTKSNEWSMPSPTPTTKPSVWEVGTETAFDNSQNNPSVLPESSKLLSSSVQWKTNTAVEPAPTPNAGQGTGAKENQNAGWGANTSTGPAQGNANVGWGTAIQGNANMGWGAMLQGNANVGWGTPVQGNANVNLGWVPSAQGSVNANTGWRPPAQGTANVNMAWGTTAQGNTNPNVGWGTTAQGDAKLNPSWGTAPQGIVNPNPAWGAPIQGNPNPSWGVPAQGNVNPNPGWGTPAQGNINANAGHPSNRMQGTGGGSSRQRGVCKFHENGYCKKGASCGYLHT